MMRPIQRLTRWLHLVALCAAPALLVGPTSAAAHETTADVAGTLVLVQEGRNVAEGVDQAVVFFTPAKKPKPPGLGSTGAASAAAPEMATVRKTFTPRMLVVPVGSQVRFPNQDPILHNAFSVSGANAFDLGLVGKGPGKTITFKEPGLVRVFCNVHQQMAGYVLVLDTPYSTRPDLRGAFKIEDLPVGPGTLSVWHERGEVTMQQVTLPLRAPLALSLPVSKARVPRHLNKFGKAYSSDSAY